MSKLTYEILGRRPAPGLAGMEHVDVEWTHSDGPVQDTIELPTTHPCFHPMMEGQIGEIKYQTVKCGRRAKIKDQLTVPFGTNISIIMQMLEERRAPLCKNLGIEP